MELVFIRHGESEANVLAREKGGFFCGRLDCSLTDEGHRQAEHLKGMAVISGADAIFSSPLKRAVDTAAAFADQDILYDDRLSERTLGEFDGKWVYELAGQDAYRKYFTDPSFVQFRHSFAISPPGGETYGDVVLRVMPFLDELKSRNYKKVIVVSHAIAIRCMLKVVRNLSEEETLKIPVKPCDPILTRGI